MLAPFAFSTLFALSCIFRIAVLQAENDVLREWKRSNAAALKYPASSMALMLEAGDANIRHYTGLGGQRYLRALVAVCETFNVPGSYHQRGKSRVRLVFWKDALLITLVRLRRGFTLRHLVHLYPSLRTTATASRACTDILLLLDHMLRDCLARNAEHLPKVSPLLKKDYPRVRHIIDASELFVPKPRGDHRLDNRLFSSYKGHHTGKYLYVLGADLRCAWVSKVFAGNVSDPELCDVSGFYSTLHPGDGVMADKGFRIHQPVRAVGGELYIPAFCVKGRLSAANVERSSRLSKVRIHVERAIERQKRFLILSAITPSLYGTVNEIVFVTAILSSYFQAPLVNEAGQSSAPLVGDDSMDETEEEDPPLPVVSVEADALAILQDAHSADDESTSDSDGLADDIGATAASAAAPSAAPVHDTALEPVASDTASSPAAARKRRRCVNGTCVRVCGVRCRTSSCSFICVCTASCGRFKSCADSTRGLRVYCACALRGHHGRHY